MEPAVAIDQPSGDILWRWPESDEAGEIDISKVDPVIGNGMLYAIGDDSIYALR